MDQQKDQTFIKLDGILMKYNNNVNTLSDEELNRFISDIYYLIWETPGFRNQVKLVDGILEKLDDRIKRVLLLYVIDRFDKIKIDRTDKFYYLIDKLLHLMSFKEILEIKDLNVLQFAARWLNKNKCEDWNDIQFVEFAAYCRPWICKEFKDIKVSESIVREVLKRDGINEQNRAVLYSFFR